MAQLFEATTLGPFRLKNRIIRSATNEHLSDKEGNLTPEITAAYEELARGGCALIITGHYSVDRDCRADPGQPVLDEGYDFGLAAPMIEAVHRQDCYILAQVSHPGPKALVCRSGQRARTAPEYTGEELAALREKYITGARVAQRAGYDGIQLHLAHGYCLSGFLDPVENVRTDEYGGPDFENRFRLAREILEGIREACGPDFPVLVKLNCNASKKEVDYTADLARAIDCCREAGVLLAEISGYDFAAMPRDYDRPYYLEAVRRASVIGRMPLALVGGLDSRAKLEEALAAGIPYVSLSRSLIRDPDFVNKLREGKEDVSPCLRCNGCYQCYRTQHTRCVMHREAVPRLEKTFG